MLSFDWHPDESFDAVVSVFSIFFVPNMQGLVQELWRILRPGGKLAVTTWGPWFCEPAYSRWLVALGKERPDLVNAFNPLVELPMSCLSGSCSMKGALKMRRSFQKTTYPFSADDWWTISLGTGLRWTIEQMGPEAAARLKADNVGWPQENRIDRVETNAIYAIGTKRS